jgi:ABC-type multidrug transport system permease subunit
MRTGRGLGAVIYKEMRQMRRDPASLFLTLLIPTIQLIIFGYAIDTEVRDIPTVIVDRAHVRATRDFVEAMNATGTFRIVSHVANRDLALQQLRAGHAKVAVVFPEDFEGRLVARRSVAVQVLVDGSDSNLANQAKAAALGLADSLSRRIAGMTPSPSASVIEARVRFLYNPDGRSERFFVPGLAGIILQLVTMTLTAAAIVRERERGTLEQLMVTPVSRLAITIGKIVPPILLGGVASLLVIALMVFLFGIPIQGSLPLLLGLTLLFLFTSLTLGLLISTIARSQLQALMLTLLVLLPSILLSGFVFPRAGMPQPIYALSWLLPATYFVEIMRGVVLRGATLPELLHMVLPLAGIGVVLSLLVAARFRRTVA